MTDSAIAANAARQIERTYCKKSRSKLYIACEEYDFTWAESELEAFRRMWREGAPLPRIAKSLKRHINEVFILALDQAELGYIRKRPRGVFGHKDDEGECGR